MLRFVGLLGTAIFLCTATHAQDVTPPPITGKAVPCTNGTAADFSCQNIDLLSFLPLNKLGTKPHSVNDLWGWTDPQTGKEYAIVGRGGGVAFVDISDPVNPVLVGNLSLGSWDIKVYDNHAFILADGMLVFDLTQLRSVTAPPVTFEPTAHYTGFESAHNLAINEATGYAYPVGGGGGAYNCNSGLFLVNIQTPTHPQAEGCFGGAGYTHDAQCVIYHGPDADYQGREICFASNVGNGLAIVDVTDKNAPSLISLTTYPRTDIAHQGWLTENHRHFLLGDEGDEGGDFPNTRTIIWDLQNLDTPQILTEYFGPTTSTDHNQYVSRRYAFQANYTSGLRILDLSDIANPREIAYFDTYPPDNERGFRGAWSVYPFFESGVVIVSSIGEGLFVLKPTVLSRTLFDTEIADFDVSVTESTASLSWTTTQERESFGFEIEHQRIASGNDLLTPQPSIDAQAWETVGFVEGNGTTRDPHTYSYHLESLHPGKHVFRLKHTTYLGAVTYSQVVEVFVVPGSHVSTEVYPNPFVNRTQFSLVLASTQQVRVEVFDALGRRVQVLHNGLLSEQTVHQFTIDGSPLPGGLYLIRTTGDHFDTTHEIILLK